MAGSVVRAAGEGKAFWMLGGLYEVKVGADETDGAVTVMQMTIPPGAGAPPHTHPGGEIVNVLDGTLRYHIADEVFEGGPGSVFHIPAGTLEYFEATGNVNLRIIATYLPGGIDQFFAEAGETAPVRELPPPASEPPDFERIAAIGARYGMHISPPS